MGRGRVGDALYWLENRRQQYERIEAILKQWREDMEGTRNLLVNYMNEHALFKRAEKVGENEISVDVRRYDGTWHRVRITITRESNGHGNITP